MSIGELPFNTRFCSLPTILRRLWLRRNKKESDRKGKTHRRVVRDASFFFYVPAPGSAGMYAVLAAVYFF